MPIPLRDDSKHRHAALPPRSPRMARKHDSFWLLPRFSRSSVGSDPNDPPTRHASRNMVAGRSTGRPEERDHVPLCQTWHTADGLGLFLRAIDSVKSKGAVLVLPRCNTEGIALRLAEISTTVAPGVHSVVLLDQAGWPKRSSSQSKPSCRCPPNIPSSIRSKTSGSYCVQQTSPLSDKGLYA